MQTGLQVVDGNTYFFNDKGAMQTGWQAVGNQLMYFDDYGKLSFAIDSSQINQYIIAAQVNAQSGLTSSAKAVQSKALAELATFRQAITEYQFGIVNR